MEGLCASPPKLIEHVAEAIEEPGGVRHHFFVHVLVDHDRCTITAVGVGHAALPVPR
jgi:hypothetical protein